MPPSLYLIILFTAGSIFAAAGQASDPGKKAKEGKIEIHRDHRIDSLLDIHKQVNEEKQTIPGYRVQLFFGTEKKKANTIKSDFLKQYPDVNAYLVYRQPDYKVRVGDFRTRSDAFNFYHRIAADFGGAFIVKDDIKPGE